MRLPSPRRTVACLDNLAAVACLIELPSPSKNAGLALAAALHHWHGAAAARFLRLSRALAPHSMQLCQPACACARPMNMRRLTQNSMDIKLPYTATRVFRAIERCLVAHYDLTDNMPVYRKLCAAVALAVGTLFLAPTSTADEGLINRHKRMWSCLCICRVCLLRVRRVDITPRLGSRNRTRAHASITPRSIFPLTDPLNRRQCSSTAAF